MRLKVGDKFAGNLVVIVVNLVVFLQGGVDLKIDV